jgi:ABC-type nitrate/sulfonate/bicarbonate transport system substrate-binding protein
MNVIFSRRAVLFFASLMAVTDCSPSGPQAGKSSSADSDAKPVISRQEAEQAVADRFDVQRYVKRDFIPKADAPAALALNPRRTLKIGLYWVLNDELTPWFVGIDKGFFSDQGLDIDLEEGGPGRDMLSSLIAGRVDVYLGKPENALFVINSPTGADLKMICALMKKTPVGWIGIDRTIPQTQASTRHIGRDELRGSRVAVTPGSEYMADVATTELGLSPGDIHILKAGATPDVLMSGAVDYYQGFSDNQPRILERNGYKNWTFFAFADIGYQDYWDVSTVTAETYQRDPQMLSAYVFALDRALRYEIAHPDEAADIAIRHTPNYPETKDEALWRIKKDITLYKGDGSEPLLLMNDAVIQKQLALLYRYHRIDLPSAKTTNP